MAAVELVRPLPRIGDVLPNDAVVIASRTTNDNATCIVLATTGPDSFEPYVVWRCRLEDRICISGDYSRSIIDAVRNYEER